MEVSSETQRTNTIVCLFSLEQLKNECSFSQDEVDIFSVKIWKHEDKQKLLNKLAEFMLDWRKGLCIATHFQCVLLDILSRTKKLVERNTTERTLVHLQFSVTLSHLIKDNTYLIPFILKYFEQFGPFFDHDTKTSKDAALIIDTACRFLNFSSALFCSLWDWSVLCDNTYITNIGTRQCFLEALSIILKLDNKEKLLVMRGHFDQQNITQLSESIKAIECRTKSCGSVIEFSEVVFSEDDLCDKYAISAHILLPKLHDSGTGHESSLVQVPSTLRNVEALSIALLSGKAVLLDGPIGSGKTSLVEHLCSLTGRNKSPYYLKVQLGDQTDSKALIGSYCCSEVPGEFVWRAGILTCAVREGYWLLLEDIDCAPMDVISVLIPLLESRILSIPGKGNIMAAPHFKLFATQRIGHGGYKGFSSNSSLLEHLWSKVHIEPLKKDEIQMIIKTRFPNLQSIANKLVDVFSLVSSDLNLVSEPDTRRLTMPYSKRLATVRDLMKWCTRVNALCTVNAELLSSQDVFLEALDCFCATFDNVDDRLSVAVAIGAKVNIGAAKVDFLCNKYKPTVQLTPLSFTVGRISLKRDQENPSATIGLATARFAFTRHSLCLLESISVCVAQNEPTLLVGETGTGKTSAVQYLASLCGRKLVVVNMSQQSDSTDLIGGFKPMEIKQLVAPLREEFERLFIKSFSRKQNIAFLTHVQQCFGKGKWELLFQLMIHSQGAALGKLHKDKTSDQNLVARWKSFGQRIQQLRAQQKQAESSLAFSFVEGALVRAIKRGDWVLLDEINLAAPETLECLNSILESSLGSVVVLERGDAEPVIRHEGFRMFACMNPANDVGKKALPAGIRNRFTEIFVNELQDEGDLKTLVVSYLKGLSPTATLVNGIVSFYVEMRNMAVEKLTDGSGNRPYYSLRTLCRGLQYVSGNPHGNILRSVYEGFSISFLTQLDRSSHNVVQSKLQEKLLGHVNSSSLLNQPLPQPSQETSNFQGYWIYRGNLEPFESPEYVFTVSVNQNLRDLVRVVSGRYFPVLIQGETSVGKTSLINWLAKASGNQCVRINNHEHTDIQEYLGCYTSDSNGKLVFKEGILVDAMRKGYWIILDELNLAPTDVLEALNRLLDDNRELFIPEIQETVKAHPQFMLFATQNPPGQYGGRKVLSRAFRNRFVELHFEELPSVELETILHKRCNLPRSYSKKLVNVMLELQARRRGSGVFAGKQGFITLRDLFRWADRYSKTPSHDGKFFDWDQQLAEDGYCLLAGRCRNAQESVVVQEVIEKHWKRKVDLDRLFGLPSINQLSESSQRILHEVLNNRPSGYDHVVFTFNMRRLAVLVARALEFNEPVLLVGDTGCGKTTICQLFSVLRGRKLYSVNCHLHTETSDFLGGLRPVRKHTEKKEGVLRLFEWCDGPLVLAMKHGDMFLADEISLADDSVLERLNSVLEPERTLVLAEKGSDDDNDARVVDHGIEQITAKEGFQLLATMNPGGDYGKKELSPALRNRFTEIWCPAIDDTADVIEIIEHNIASGISLNTQYAGSSGIGDVMVEFVDWFKKCSFGKRCTVSIRDYLSWVNFINVCSGSLAKPHRVLDPALSYVHGAFLVFLDALGLGMSSSLLNDRGVSGSRQLCYEFLHRQIKNDCDIQELFPKVEHGGQDMETDDTARVFTISGFSIPRGPIPYPSCPRQYALNAPTTAENAARVIRALQLHRPILLEGSPGVGKTSLVSALAKASGYKLLRINLSEQTDISDLFGADLPSETSQDCSFSWCDGPLLQALKSGYWIVLDELNLASQAVLEGLNACFDHRGEIFIPELGMSFQVQHEKTRFFACQNPLNQGGGRKGLPKSFLNRFTQVYIEPLSSEDLNFIAETLYDVIDKDLLHKMIIFNSKIHQQCVSGSGKRSGSWEFNLRDIFRWCDLMIRYQGVGHWNPVSFVHLIYAGRMRTQLDRKQVWGLCLSIFGHNSAKDISPLVHVTPSHIQVGRCIFPKHCNGDEVSFENEPHFLLHRSLKPLESLLTCLQMNWMAIVIGTKSCGKTSLVKMAAELTGTKLDVMAMNSSTDTTELLGGYEQVDLRRPWNELKEQFENEVLRVARDLLLTKNLSDVLSDIKRLLHFLSKLNEEQKPQANPLDENEPMPMMDLVAMVKKFIADAVSICREYNISDVIFGELNKGSNDLYTRLEKCNGNPHVSGKFEWVDGQLVRALKNGYWLLIDNVNFCSPSVLDRLNALLEPGGVLSMNERGVVGGKIPVVEPHGDFRLILAMDMKHGEISRAMRNRGVEIFMNEDMEDTSDQHDLRGILQASGCANPKAIMALENFHKKHKNLVEGSVLKIAHAASLFNQLVERGTDLEKAFGKSVSHVYGDDLGSNVDESTYDFKNYYMENPSPRTPQILPSAALFQKDSTLAVVQHHMNPLMKICKETGTSQRETEIAVHLFLEWASQSDWKLRLQWLQSYISSTKYSQLLGLAEYSCKEMLNSSLWKKLFSVYEALDQKYLEFHLEPAYQPLNIKVNGPLYEYVQCKANEEVLHSLISLTNRLFLFGLHLQLEAMLKSSCDSLASGKYFSSPLDMSIAFTKGFVQLENLPHPGVVHLYPLCRVFNDFVRHFINNNDIISLNDDNTYKIWTSLRHYRRFFEACLSRYSEVQDLQSIFGLHWKLFKDQTLVNVCQVLDNHQHQQSMPEEMTSVISCLDDVFMFDNKQAECHWALIYQFGNPTTFVAEDVCLVWEKVTKLFHELLLDNNNMVRAGHVTSMERRAHLMTLVNNMSSLIKLRENKEKREHIEMVLGAIHASVNDIQRVISRDELMHTGSSANVIKKLSDITLRNDEVLTERKESGLEASDMTKLIHCDVLQSLTTLVANCSFLECLSCVGRVGLCEKLHLRTEDESLENCIKTLAFHHDYCTTSVRKVSLNASFICYLLSDLGENILLRRNDSILELLDSSMLYLYSESLDTYPQKEQGNVQSSSLFQSLSFTSDDVLSNNVLNCPPQLSLVDVDKKVLQFTNLAKFLWLNHNYIENMDFTLSKSGWEFLMISFIRFLHSTTSLVSEVSPNISEIFSTLLGMSKLSTSHEELWSTIHVIGENFVKRYSVLCSGNDLRVVQDCLKNLLGCLQKDNEREEIDKENEQSLNASSSIDRGWSWIYLGFLQLTVFRPVGNVDPVEEENVRINHMKQEIMDVESELKVRSQTEELVSGVRCDQTIDDASLFTQVNPGHVANLVRHRDSLRSRLSEVGDETTYRPCPPKFRKIVDVIQHFSSSVGNYSAIQERLVKLQQLNVCLKDERVDEESCVKTKSLLVHLKMWTKSVEKFLMQLKEYVPYEDILGPYMTGLCQLLQGVKLLVTGTEKMLKRKAFAIKKRELKYSEASAPCEMLQYVLPFSSTQRSSFERSEFLLGEKAICGLEVLCAMNGSSSEDNSGTLTVLKSKVRKQALKLLQASARSSGYTTPRDVVLLKNATDHYMDLWLQFEETRKLREQEEGSLYKLKTKVFELDQNEEEQDQKEVAELFTSFDQEYTDAPSEANDKTKETSDALQIAEDDLNHLCRVHCSLVSSLPNASQVLSTLHHSKLAPQEKIIQLRIMVDGYKLATELVNSGNLTEQDLVTSTSQSHLFMSSFLARSLSSHKEESNEYYNALFGSRHQNYDIYHDCNLKEISQAMPVLVRFLTRLEELLEEWPGHPTLVQLTKTIRRILSFPVTSSVMKILSGLEIVLMQAQDWEANASRHVSIKNHLDEITQIIISWRKMELSFWSSLLDVCEERASEKANKWWFHIYHTLRQYCGQEEKNSEDVREFTRVLKGFVESSPLGEFPQRLNMLYSFYNQITIDENQHSNSGVIKTILWNVHSYYKQFEADANNLILKARTPIEKELKAFIKIAKWKDINFWAMKQAATKSHYTLLKFMKKYQVSLEEPVDKVLITSSHGTLFKNIEESVLEQNTIQGTYLAPLFFKDILEENVNQDTHLENVSLQLTPRKMFMKMRKLSEKALAAVKYQTWSDSLNSFTGEVINAAQFLQQLEIGDKVGKKRTEFRKHIQTQKKRGLADLFKALTTLGLSYRKGVALAQQDSVKDPMLVECDDIASKLRNGDSLLNNNHFNPLLHAVSLEQLYIFTLSNARRFYSSREELQKRDRPINSSILVLLENCKEYYQKSVTRSAVLQNVLPSPSKELTLGDISRIKGFSEELRHITQKQRENLTHVGRLFSDLRLMSMQLERIVTRLPSQSCVLPPQKSVAQWTVTLDELLDTCLQTSNEILLLLETCPNSKIDQRTSPVPHRLSQLAKSCKQDPDFLQVKNILSLCVDELSSIKSTIHLQVLTLFSIATETKEISGLFVVTWSHYECLKSSFDKLDVISQQLDQVVELDTRDHGLGKLVHLLKEKIIDARNDFMAWERKMFSNDVNNVEAHHMKSPYSLPRAKENILLTFQTWLKLREKLSMKYSATEDEANSDETDSLENLIKNLDNDLSQDTKILNLAERTRDLHSVIKSLQETIDHYYENNLQGSIGMTWKIITDLVPSLCQYVLLAEYYISQLLRCHRNTCKLHSVLLGIFLELLQKGFCLPPDEEEAEGDGTTSFENSEDCGIGEGEGMKDISDKIEDEEQLLGANAEMNKDDDEVKEDFLEEEEHGIEMTDDFEAKACDMDEQEENSENDEEEGTDEHIDEQMGENEGDSKLDERIWGDSDDEDENENDNGDEERGEGASAKAESDLVAKEENQGAAEQSKNDANNKAKEDDKEEEEIHELKRDMESQGNLDDDKNDNVRNETELNDEQGKPEDMELSEELNLDDECDQENGGSGDEDKENKNDLEQNAETIVEDESKEEDKSDGDQKDGDDDDNTGDLTKENDENEPGVEMNDEEEEENISQWRTDSETTAGHAETMEDNGIPDQSYGRASGEQSEGNNEEEQTEEGEDDGLGNTVSQEGNQEDISRNITNTSRSTEMSSYRKQLNKSRAERSLGSSDESVQKRPKVIDSSDTTGENIERETKVPSDLVEHLTGADQAHDTQVYDAATLEQQQRGPGVRNESDEERMQEDWDLAEEKSKHEPEMKEVNTDLRPVSENPPSSKKEDDEDLELPDSDVADASMDSDQQEMTQFEQSHGQIFVGDTASISNETVLLDFEKCRRELESQLSRWREQREGTGTEEREAQEAWQQYEMLTSLHAQQLCEQLRIVMEPSIANKLKGDYRTGKRLNMRKVIPYIASQFRKDKIWLRRTKRSKRQYQILLAVDDSSSMADNHSKQLAFESLAVITSAITRLEAGEIAVCSFGEDVQLLHPFHETFSDQSGANILRRFTFEQKKTKVAQLVDSCTSIMVSARSRARQGTATRLDTSQLLLIVSDGRGIFLEGVETVQRVVRTAKEAGIFLVFVILDNPRNKDSVLDIKVPIFRPGALPQLKSYIEQFPFPYYIILRDVSALPETLSDSLRQWFELVTNMSD